MKNLLLAVLFFLCWDSFAQAQCFQFRQSEDLIVYGEIISIDTFQVDGLPVLPEYFEGKRLNKDSTYAAINRKNERERIADSLRTKAIEEKAKHQADIMLDDARAQIERETRAAEKELEKHVGELSVKILKQSLENVFTEKEQAEIVTKASKAMKTN